jgi:hypothetical protein
MNKIENIKQLDALISQTYMYGLIVAVVALVIAFLIANLINWEGGKTDSSYMKRRIWFIITGVTALIGFFLYNSIIVMDKIAKAPLQAKFSNSNLITIAGILLIFFVGGIITMMIFRTSKWGSILGKSK